MHDPNTIRSLRSRRPARSSGPVGWTCALLLIVITACSGEAPLPGDPLRLVSASLADPVLNEPYQHDLTPTGGLRPYTYTLEEGRLPPGIALQGGTLIGTPTELGRFEFTVSVADANLSSSYETFTVTVRDLPVPVLDLVVPDTEIRGDTQLRVGVRDARRLRGVRVWIDWQHDAVRMNAGAARASRDDLVIFESLREGGIAVDVAVLGEPLSGDHELFRLNLTSDSAVVLGLDVRTEFLYGDRHSYDESRAGAPRRDPPPSGAEDEADGIGDDPEDEGPEGDEPGRDGSEDEGPVSDEPANDEAETEPPPLGPVDPGDEDSDGSAGGSMERPAEEAP